MNNSHSYIALIAHDAKKEEMISLVERHRIFLDQDFLVATRTTGSLITERTGLVVHSMLSGPQGGDLQIGALVATERVKAMVFLRDPLTAHPHEPDISALLKVCDIHNIPLATNVASADIILDRLTQLALKA